MQSKDTKAKITKRMSKVPGVRVFKFNLMNIIILVVAVIAGYFLFSSLYQPSLGTEITFDALIKGIVNNKFAQVDLRDDGKAIAYEKYVDVANSRDNKLELEEKSGTDVVNELEKISIDDFLQRVALPKSFQEWQDVFISRKREILRADEIIIGDNFVLIKKINSKGGDLLIEDTNETEFKQKLADNKVNLNDVSLTVTYLRSSAKSREVDQIKEVYNNEQYSDVWTVNNLVIARLKNEQVQTSFTLLTPVNTDLVDYLQNQGYKLESGNVEIRAVAVPVFQWENLFMIAAFIGFGAVVFFMFRSFQGSNNSLVKFGQTRAGLFFGRRPEVTFKDVAGVDEAKEELKEVVMFLKEPRKFTRLGARIPKGLLLVGSPGTGKTLLARAIAGEAGVPFFHTSGSEFEEMLVGAGASRVRDLFEKAKKASPSLIFIDEIDAVARKRGTTVQSSTTEQTLNQILVEMDGFEKTENVIVIAATNRPDVLDPAILRPGRFDRRVVLDLPDMEGRKQIIAIHAENKPLAKGIDMDKIAKRTVGFSGADIENMLNEAAIIAAKADRDEMTYHDIEEASTKVVIGPERRRKRSEDELKMTAYHEAGHAIIAKLAPKSDPVHRITIISRGMSLGSTMQLPQEDKMQQTKEELESRIKVLLGGRAAEEIIFKDITGGASNDIEKATSIVRKMVKMLGMSKKLGLVKYGASNDLQYLGYGYGEQRDYSEKTAELIDDEVRDIIQHEYQQVLKMLNDNIDILHKVSLTLLEKEVLEGEEFDSMFANLKK